MPRISTISAAPQFTIYFHTAICLCLKIKQTHTQTKKQEGRAVINRCFAMKNRPAWCDYSKEIRDGEDVNQRDRKRE